MNALPAVFSALLLATAACAPPSPPSPATQADSADSSAAKTPSQSAPAASTEHGKTTLPSESAAAREITIERVEIGNPLVVIGKARTFENGLVLRARDVHGAVLAQTFTASDGEMGQHNPYQGSLWLARDPGSRVTVEAFEISAKDGSERSLVAVSRAFAVPTIEVSLDFPDRGCTGIAAFRRSMPKSLALARLLLEALLAGPTDEERKKGAAAPFPEGSRVESVNLRDGILTVDFNDRLQNVGGSCAAQMIRESVTQTLRQLPNVKKVVIRAGGSESLALQP